MVDQDDIRTGKAIQQRTGRTFHLATRLLPERTRHPTYVLYGFFRVADEIVDQSDPGEPTVLHERLDHIRGAVLGDAETDDPVLSAMRTLRVEHDLASADVEAFVDAMRMDVERTSYERYRDLEQYMRGSAVAVGNLVLDVMDPAEAERARPHAAALAEAFQLTNFLRDVREDVRDYDRVYLPRETLDAHDVTRPQLADCEVTPGFRAAMQTELVRTEERYRTGVAGIRYLPEDCQFAVLLAATLYAEHHRLIRARHYDVLTDPPSLSRPRRLQVLARTWWHWRRHRDPAAAFYAASPVPEPDASTDCQRPLVEGENPA